MKSPAKGLGALIFLALLPATTALSRERRPVPVCTLENTDAAGTMSFSQRMEADPLTQFSWHPPISPTGPWFTVNWYSEGGISRPPGPEARVQFYLRGTQLHGRRAHLELLRRPGTAIAGPPTRRGVHLYVSIPLYRLGPFAEGAEALVLRVVDEASGEVLAEAPFDPAVLDNPARAYEAARADWEAVTADPTANCQPLETIIVT